PLADETELVRPAHRRPVPLREHLPVELDRSTRHVGPRVPAGREADLTPLAVLEPGQPEIDVLADAQTGLAAVAGREQGEATTRRLTIETPSGRHAVVIDDAEGAESRVRGIEVVAEREGVAAVEPAPVRPATLVGPAHLRGHPLRGVLPMATSFSR